MLFCCMFYICPPFFSLSKRESPGPVCIHLGLPSCNKTTNSNSNNSNNDNSNKNNSNNDSNQHDSTYNHDSYYYYY